MEQQSNCTDLQKEWPHIVPEDLAARSTPAQIIDGTLVIAVKSAAIGQQLAFLAERICAKAGVRNLRLRVAPANWRATK